MTYIRLLASVLFAHGVRWWASLTIAYVLGTGAFADYQAAREKINGWQDFYMLPDELPLWWIVVPFLVWLIVSLIHSEVQRQYRTPRLFFGNPEVVEIGMVPNEWVGVINPEHFIWLGKIIVRNRPINREEGRSAILAHCVVRFYDPVSWRCVLKIESARWTENRKPRLDEFLLGETPRWSSDWYYRTLEPNNSPNHIDFVLKDDTDDCVYGFDAASQNQNLWKNKRDMLTGRKYFVKLTIESVGSAPQEAMLVLRHGGPGTVPEIVTKEYDDAQNWIGVG